jgi:RNA recognition motif-containing protein
MNKRLFVAGLPFSTTDEELRNLFAGVGLVVSARVIMDRDTGRSKGFGFVEMETPEEAATAIAKLNDTDFGGRKLIVAEAKPQEDKHDRFQKSGGFGRKEDFGRREGGRGSFGRDARGGGHRPGRGRFSR